MIKKNMACGKCNKNKDTQQKLEQKKVVVQKDGTLKVGEKTYIKR